MQSKDTGNQVRHGGSDLLRILKAEAVRQAAEEDTKPMHPGHVERIGTAVGHVNRGIQVLNELLRQAAKRVTGAVTSPIRREETSPPSTGPIADAAVGGPPMKTFVTGDVTIDLYKAALFFEAEAANLANLKSAILDAARDEARNPFVSRKDLSAIATKAREIISEASVPADVLTRSEVPGTIIAPVLEWARKVIADRMLVVTDARQAVAQMDPVHTAIPSVAARSPNPSAKTKAFEPWPRLEVRRP